MRVLMLSQFYPPIVGGEEQHVRALSVELVSRGYEVTVVTLWHQGLAAFELDQGVRVYRIRSSTQRLSYLFEDSGRRYAPPFPDPEAMLALRRIIKHERPEIVHAHNWLVHSFFPLKAWCGARLIVTLHNYNLACPKTTLLYHNTCCDGPGLVKCPGCAIEQYGFAKGIPTVFGHRLMGVVERRAVDMFVVVNRAVAVGNGLVDSSLPFQVIPNFMPDKADEGDAQPYLAQLPTEDYLLFVGAWNYQKGIDVLLRAYAGLTDAPPLVLIGYETPEWARLRVECPANVLTLKNWPHFAVMKAWRRSLIALAPSVGPETFGMAVMEAMSLGCPVIASRIGGLIDLVADGETGFLVEPGDPSALQQAIRQLLADSHLRSCMGRAGLQKVARFQASTVIPQIDYLYRQVVA